MELGLIGLGKMGGNMAERLRRAGHGCRARLASGFLDDLPVPSGWADLVVACSVVTPAAAHGGDHPETADRVATARARIAALPAGEVGEDSWLSAIDGLPWGEGPGQIPIRGMARTWITYWHPVRDRAGTIVAVNVAAEEITERKQAEAALRQRGLDVREPAVR